MNRQNGFFLVWVLAAPILVLFGCAGNEPAKNGSGGPPAAAKAVPGGPMVVNEVVDVRPAQDPEDNPVIIGSINGQGLMVGDKVLINSDTTLATIYGNDTWITFSIPVATVGNQKSFTLQVIRPANQEKSKVFTVNFK